MKLRNFKFPNGFRSFAAAITLALLVGVFSSANGQPAPTSEDRYRAQVILQTVKDDLKKHYYDPNYRGMDLEVRFKTAAEKLKQATSIGQLFGIVAQVLLELNDSHTFFVPPGRAARTEYGWKAQMIGNKSYLVSVKPGSDGDTKGLRPGDEIYSVDGIELTRKNVWVFEYLYNALRPQPGMRLIVIKPDGKQQQIEVLAKITPGKRVTDLSGADEGADFWNLIREAENEAELTRSRYIEIGDDLMIWKMPEFYLEKVQVDDMVGKVRKRKALILDLRGNPGGLEETFLRMIGNFFDREVKVGDVKTRKETRPMLAKSRGDQAFGGKLIVLIDSKSGSASELFARVVQLEKRGTVIGDQSGGAVMRSRQLGHQLGADVVVFYGVSVTEADIVMTDGKSLEHVGVTPDEIRLPTASDLAAQRDPVLAYAASLAGVTITPEKAGALFPREWRK